MFSVSNLTMEEDVKREEEVIGTKVSENIFASLTNTQEKEVEEYQYLNLIQNILENGHMEMGRNGNTKSIFGASMRFSLQNGKIPILTTKKTAWKTCLKELLWFISGETNNKLLTDQNVHIWDGNASHEFLVSRGLGHYAAGELGAIYGHQWRHFNGTWRSVNDPLNSRSSWIKNKDSDWTPDQEKNDPTFYKGVDQLQQIIDQLKNPATRNSRRLIMSAWNPCQLDQMALPPCHVMCQFNVHDGNKLSCSMYQRSTDCILGEPINVASYSFLTHLLAKHCGLEAYEFVHFMGNCHLYENAFDAAALQITREPYPFPTVSIKQIRDNINDYKVEDFELHNYQHHPQIKVAMVA
jgi:thymidylate synthase